MAQISLNSLDYRALSGSQIKLGYCRGIGGQAVDYRTIEGSWEKVLEHSDELAGHHVKVIVLQEDNKPQSLAEALKGKIGLLEFDVPEDLHQRTGEVLTDILDEKRRK